MSDEMRINLRGMDEWNAICYFSDDEQEVIDQYLDEVKEDTDYYNVVLDFSDCDKSSTLYAKWTAITYTVKYNGKTETLFTDAEGYAELKDVPLGTQVEARAKK